VREAVYSRRSQIPIKKQKNKIMKKISLFIEKLWVCAGIALYPAISLIWYRDYRVSRSDSRKFAGCFACGLGA